MTGSFIEVWDRRECVSRHSTMVDAIRSVRMERDARTLTVFDMMGRIAGTYRDGREVQ